MYQVYGPGKDHEEKLDSYLESRIQNLQDIKDALEDDDPYQETLDKQIANYEAVLNNEEADYEEDYEDNNSYYSEDDDD